MFNHFHIDMITIHFKWKEIVITLEYLKNFTKIEKLNHIRKRKILRKY